MNIAWQAAVDLSNQGYLFKGTGRNNEEIIALVADIIKTHIKEGITPGLILAFRSQLLGYDCYSDKQLKHAFEYALK